MPRVLGRGRGSVAGVFSDPLRFRAFYDRMLPRVYSHFFCRVGGVRPLAEDLTQETFLAAVRASREERVVDNPEAWVMGIARHKLLDHYRRVMREERDRELAASVAGEGVVPWQGPEERQQTLEALAAVPAAQRAALALRYIDDLPVAEVAEALGRSVHATESLLARGRESFRRHYAGGGNGQG